MSHEAKIRASIPTYTDSDAVAGSIVLTLTSSDTIELDAVVRETAVSLRENEWTVEDIARTYAIPANVIAATV